MATTVAPSKVTAQSTVPRPARVAVVVLNWCNEQDTVACVRSVLASDYPGVVPLIVDNGSPDGSGPRIAAQFPDVAYLQTGRNLGYAGGNNAGFAWAAESGADYVVVLNNDAEIAPDCVSRLVAAAQGERVAVVAPKILSRERPDEIWYGGGALAPLRGTGIHWHEGARDDPAQDPPPGTDVTFATGCCFLITADALRRTHGFEPSYFAYVEDVDLSYRVRAEQGLRIVYEPRARVLHRSPVGAAELSEFHILQRDRNRRRFARLRLSWAARAAFAAWFYPTRLLRAAGYALASDAMRARAVLRGAFGRL